MKGEVYIDRKKQKDPKENKALVYPLFGAKKTFLVHVCGAAAKRRSSYRRGGGVKNNKEKEREKETEGIVRRGTVAPFPHHLPADALAVAAREPASQPLIHLTRSA